MIGPLEHREERPRGFIWLLVATQVRDAGGGVGWDVFLRYDPLPEHERYWPKASEPRVIIGDTRVSDSRLSEEVARLRRLVTT